MAPVRLDDCCDVPDVLLRNSFFCDWSSLLALLQELPGHGQSCGVPTLVLVGVVGGLHHWGNQNLRVWTWIPARLFFFPSLWDSVFGQAVQDPPQPVGLPHHL